MIMRLISLLRETWWLALIVLVFSGACAIFVDPMLAWMMSGASAVVFLYFAFVRYDDDGEEAARTPEMLEREAAEREADGQSPPDSPED